MKSIIICFSLILLISSVSYSQKRNNAITSYEKWCKAVVNIECRTGAGYSDERKKLDDLLQEQKISRQQYDDLVMDTYIKAPRYTGTAIFFKHNKNYFFITARHVVADIISYPNDSTFISTKIFVIDNESNPDVVLPSGFKSEPIMIMNYGVGTTDSRYYVFSDKQKDMALISLNNKFYPDDRIVRKLLDKGYQPIEFSDLDMSLLSVGQKINSFGFPQDFAQGGRKNITKYEYIWDSEIISAPVVSEGTIQKDVQKDYYFLGNIFVTHGDSGGAIVSNNKLVGIVSGGTYEKIPLNGSFKYFKYRQTRFIKINQLIPLLEELNKRL